ncbi:MAG: CYTH domain-containing protein [Gammaproteobacteria bacterium]|nr:CYTH domain-containing protein [Gammaproteobacteria bacterium]
MPREIERKFLLQDDSWRASVESSKRLVQGYLPGMKTASVRVRISGHDARLNIKSATLDVSRLEYEYPLPLDEAEEILERLCERPLIEKTRHHVPHGGHLWEVDEFAGDNAGLVVAEIELASADEAFERPSWVGDEVSDDPAITTSAW